MSGVRLGFNDLLRAGGIDPQTVLVLRHRPREATLNQMFDRIVSRRRDLFDVYQGQYGSREEHMLTWATHLASFIRDGGNDARFIGLYAVTGSRPMSLVDPRIISAIDELVKLGMESDAHKSQRLWFDLRPEATFAHLSERLVIAWHGGGRSWARWAHKNDFEVIAIERSSSLATEMPHCSELVLGRFELGTLSASWAAVLSEWRGIYVIIDLADGLKYVGAAYGADNLLGRWRDYAKTGHGGNKLLRARDPENFRFAILRRLSPDDSVEAVIRAEQGWKTRLITRAPHGLNEN